MKKIIILALVQMAMIGSVFALDDITLPVGGSFYDGKTLQPQHDSGTDTVTANYTPRYIGDMLVGQTSSSNSLWVAVGLTTGDWSVVTTSGGPYAADDIADDAVTEAKLKAVDSATDEDILTYEETTGDFEWHSVAEIIAQMAAGGLPNDSVLEADLKAVDAAADEDFLSYESTTGDFEWHSAAEIQAKFTEGSYADSTVVSSDIKDDSVVDADINANAAIKGSKLDLTSGTGAATFSGTLTVEQDVTIADTNNIARTYRIGDDYKVIIEPTALGTVTNGQELGALSAYYTISAAGAVTCAVANASAAGQMFTIVNTGSEAITFAGSGNLKSASDIVLGEYDTLSLYAAATNAWVPVSQRDN